MQNDDVNWPALEAIYRLKMCPYCRDSATDDVRRWTCGCGRTMVGVVADPQQWFMSSVDDPTNYDYAPEAI